jgi:hypothetical protein
MSSERRSGGGLGAACVLLIFIGAIVKFWVWIAAVLGGLMVRVQGVDDVSAVNSSMCFL